MKRSELRHIIREEILNKIFEGVLAGRRGAGHKAEEFDPEEMQVGIAVEREHTDTDMMAQQIAIDHLAENPKYYTELIKAGIVDEKPALELAKKFGWISENLTESVKLDQPVENIKKVDFWESVLGMSGGSGRIYKLSIHYKNGAEQRLSGPKEVADAFGINWNDAAYYRKFVPAMRKKGYKFEITSSEFDISERKKMKLKEILSEIKLQEKVV